MAIMKPITNKDILELFDLPHNVIDMKIVCKAGELPVVHCRMFLGVKNGEQVTEHKKFHLVAAEDEDGKGAC